MPHIITAPLGAKAQVTLPKSVRQALGLKEKHDLVGFIVEGRRVALTRIEPVTSSDPFTEEEWKKIARLVARPSTAIFESSKDSIRYLKKRLHL